MTECFMIAAFFLAFFFLSKRVIEKNSLSLIIKTFRAWISFLKNQILNLHRERIEKLLERNGEPRAMLNAFITKQLRYASMGFAFGLLCIWVKLPPFLPFVLAPMGYLFPIFCIRNSIRIRKSKMIYSLPYYFDVLTLSMEAGLDLVASIEELVQRDSANPLQDEFQTTLKMIRMGETRAAAFREMARRTEVEPLLQFATSIHQSEELGASLSPLLRIQSQTLQQEIFQIAEEKAQRAPVKMLLPLVIFIFPVVFLLLLSPVLIRLWSEF